MIDRNAETAAAYLYKLFNSDSIVPEKAAEGFLKILPGCGEGFAGDVIGAWRRFTEKQQISGNPARDIAAPLILTRGVPGKNGEDSLRFYFPEEKILINRRIFREKLSGFDFAGSDLLREKQVVEELRNEAIGLSDQEVLIYYNLLKVDMLNRQRDRQQPAGLDPGESIVSSDVIIIGQGRPDYADEIITLLGTNFLSMEKMAAVNERRPLDSALLREAVSGKISRPVHNPRVYCLMFGFETDKYAQFIRDFLSLTASRWGGSFDEIVSYFMAYQLMNSARPETVEKMDLSVSLKNFVNDNLGRAHPVYYCAILFITVFTYIIIMQVTEISGKYFSQPEGQREKLRKLYDSQERINMLVNNAMGIASGKISSFRAESREILSNIKKILSKNSDIITSSDMFKTRYNL